MQKRSHLLLARSLLSDRAGRLSRPYELAFLFGSFQPDCNPFSYLKGSLRGKLFGGHTYGNSKRYVARRIRYLQSRKRWGARHYYAMGQLTHYVADAFTWPHNPHFPGVGWEHHVYETALRLALREKLCGRGAAAPDDGKRGGVRGDLPDALESLHERYVSEAAPGVETDIRYILAASELLMAECRPGAREEASALSDMIGDFA